MRTCSLLAFALASIATVGCGAGIATAPPPPAPAPIEPHIEGGPTTPPAAGHGRVVLDAEGEPAKVSRVVSYANHKAHGKPSVDATTSLAPPRTEELLCITPCAVDLRQGAHTFVFTSTRDPLRSSTADVAVSSRTLFVRHAIGSEGHVHGSYVGGALLTLLGGGLIIFGGTVTGFGALARPAVQEDGTTSNPRALLVPGLVTLGLGLATGTVGYLLMAGNRPVQQPGATTYWVERSRSSVAME